MKTEIEIKREINELKNVTKNGVFNNEYYEPDLSKHGVEYYEGILWGLCWVIECYETSWEIEETE